MDTDVYIYIYIYIYIYYFRIGHTPVIRLERTGTGWLHLFEARLPHKPHVAVVGIR